MKYNAHIDYSPCDSFSKETNNLYIHDLYIADNKASSPQEFRLSLNKFLLQFENLHACWDGEFEPLTISLVASSAEFQLAWFKRSTLIPTKIQDEGTIIAMALRCLVIANEIGQVTNNWSTRHFRRRRETYVQMAETEQNSKGGLCPSIKVWRLDDGDDVDLSVKEPEGRETLASMLQNTIQTAQRVLCFGRPQDWPSLFYVLCILILLHGELRSADTWTGAFESAAEELERSLFKFCHLFHLGTGNIQPLRFDFDIEQYASMVGGNELLVEHYQRMNEIWVTNSMSCPLAALLSTQGL